MEDFLPETNFSFGKNEDGIIEDVLAHIGKTYHQHYVGTNNVQAVDIWENLGTLETTARDNAIKYLVRYGKKNGKNKEDMYKAIHFIVLMLYCHDDYKRVKKVGH